MGTPFYAVITQPIGKFQRGEVVIGKLINDNGDFRIRNMRAKEASESEQFHVLFRHCLQLIHEPKKPAPAARTNILTENEWQTHARTLAGRLWFTRKPK